MIELLENAYEKHQNKKILQLLIWCYQKSNQLREACNAYRIYLQKNDAETDFLFNASLCFKKSREIEEAIELSERVKLREPHNVRNLLHLADMYIYSKNFKRARKLLNKILAYEPENEKAKFLFVKLNELS
ncbi:MAG: tetratricopeptide repeat protein [Leptospiraceae bacterium]|nr:tetratricopeptide repeat protein [Leptospiraceae bacterium]